MSWLPNWITGYDVDNAERAAAADARLQELNQEKYGVPYVNEDDYVPVDVAYQQINQAFVEGLDEGRQNIRSGIGATINSFFKNTFGLLPWQLWAIAAVAGVVYFWPVLRPAVNRLTKRFA